MLTKIIVYLKRNLKRFFGGGQIAETILFVWNHRCVLVWAAMVGLAMGPFAACLCPLLPDYNYFGFILMHYHVVMKWNKLGSPPDFHFDLSECLSLSFRPSYYILDAWRKEFASNSSAFPGLTPSLTPHILFSIPRHFLLFWSRAEQRMQFATFFKGRRKNRWEKKNANWPLCRK